MTTAVAPDAPQVTVTASGKWRGVLGFMDEWSADARMLQGPDDGAPVRIRPLPLPLLVQPELAPGHDGGKLGIGVIDRIWTENGFVMGEGRFDMADPLGAELARKVGEGFIRFVSLDVDDATAHQVCLAPDGQTILEDCDPNDPNAGMGMVYTGWRVMGATLLAHPAFPDAHIALADDSTAPAPETAQAAVRLADSPAPAPSDPGAEIVGYDPAWGCVVPNADGTAWETADCQAEGALPANATGDGPFDPEQVVQAADAAPAVPEEQVQDEGTGCVAPDPDNEGAWLQVACDTPGAVPANEDGTGPLDEVTDAANAADGAAMAITSFSVDTSLPWAERDREWDGDQARQNVAGWATTGEGDNAKIDPAKMSKAFLIVNGPEENEGSYQYGVADMVDGELKLVWNGVTAANAALNGARGGGDVPGKQAALADIKTLYGKAAKAFDDPSITDNEGAMATVPHLADAMPPEGQDAATDGEGKDQGNGCVCEQEDGSYAPCDCTEDGAVTADADGQPLPADEADDSMEMAAVPEGCEPCKAVVITASATGDTTAAPGFQPPAEWFDKPQLTGPQPITVDPDTGRLYGHLAAWGTCHVGFRDRCVTPPRSHSGYGFFHTARIPVSTGHLDVGIITMDTGHAPLEMTAASSISHYDNTGTQAAVCRVGEDEFGIWVAGVTLPFVTAEERLRLSLASFSGDWRHIRGGAELVAALAVNTPGFPLPARKTGTDNAEYALVAAGALPRPAADLPPAPTQGHATATVTVDSAEVARIVLGELDAREQRAARMARVTTQLGAVKQAAASERIAGAARSMQALATSLAAERVTAARTKVTGLDIEIPKGMRALKSDLEFVQHPEFANWVDQQGGLPRKIKSVAKHLQAKGMGESQSIAVAVNVAKKACSTGDTNWPGKQTINAKSKAEYCAAVARWEQMKAAAKAS